MLINRLLSKIFGSRNERTLRRMQKIVVRINALEPSMQGLSDMELQAKTPEFRQRFANGESLDSLLPEAFAVVREVSRRVLDMRHFDVQLIGGMVLHSGKIAEMRTGEGKTLMATLAAYLNALPGLGVHIVTVNDYLAKRDAAWMGPIYEFLGMTVGVTVSNMSPIEKQAAYATDITYGTNNEFGFDYLRDNMAFSLQDKVQRQLNFAIVDEVDSILIDEARTPLIISGAAEDSSERYVQINRLIPKLKRQTEENDQGDYTVDEKQRQVYLTESGHQHVEEIMVAEGLLKAGESLYAPHNITLMHHLNAALRAHTLFNIDVDYIIQNGQVVIVDEHTGRIMPGRRWSDGIHQAVEAKEGVAIQNENQTLASITFQNYFRLYQKLSGMTGTADTEAYEFQQIYGLEVVVIPTHKSITRLDQADLVYLTKDEKFGAIIKDIKECVKRHQPVLVGTASIETSEYLSNLLQKEKIDHQVLNAKQHEREAHIIANAGRPSTVTIATNMAGRGTDIVLGGNLNAELADLTENSPEKIAIVKAAWQQRHEQVVNAGGLYVLGTERHESRRIDNQLRGRSGRQGDPGITRFYLSLEDDLMRIFASERVSLIMRKFGMGQGIPLESKFLSRTIENAQRKVEGRNFDIRKQLLEYDDIANDQRKVIYEQRSELMAAEDISDTIKVIRQDVLQTLINQFIPPHSLEEQWDVTNLEQRLEHDFAMQLPLQQWLSQDEHLHEETLRERILQEAENIYQQKETLLSIPVMRQFEKSIMLQSLDMHWKEHLAAMDHLRQGIHLRGYAQRNPKQEYKRESFELFASMLERLKYDVVAMLCTVQVRTEMDVRAIDQQRQEASKRELHFAHDSQPALLAEDEQGQSLPGMQAEVIPIKRTTPKIGRNDPCPCGSGRKYKQCHGTL